MIYGESETLLRFYVGKARERLAFDIAVRKYRRALDVLKKYSKQKKSYAYEMSLMCLKLQFLNLGVSQQKIDTYFRSC